MEQVACSLADLRVCVRCTGINFKLRTAVGPIPDIFRT